jgi:two-component system sensor histidine kinase UhpB
VEGSDPQRVSIQTLIALAAAYAACYELTRHFSFSHWFLPAGLRLASLLLVPRRYWPALALGETLPVIEAAALCAGQFGGGWEFFAGTPLIVLYMPVVAFVQRRSTLYRPNGYLNVGMVLLLTLVCALLNAIVNELALESALLASPGAWPEIDARAYFFAYVLGAYLGALTLTPSILALREYFLARQRATWQPIWQRPRTRGLLGASAGLMLTAMLVAQHLDGWALQLCRMSTLLPVLVLTLRYGWQGAGLAGLPASIVVASTSTTLLDPPMIHAQVVLAFALSAALVAGAHIARRKQRYEEPGLMERTALD